RSEPTATSEPSASVARALAGPPASAGSSTRRHATPSSERQAMDPVPRWPAPRWPSATYPPPASASIATTSAPANTGSSGTASHGAPSVERQNRARRSPSSGPTAPPTSSPSPVATIATARSRSAPPLSVGIRRRVQSPPAGAPPSAGLVPGRPGRVAPARPRVGGDGDGERGRRLVDRLERPAFAVAGSPRDRG